MNDTQPFQFTVDTYDADGNDEKCRFCRVYHGEAVVHCPVGADNIHLCRSCLRRMRETLKQLQASLPRLPKRVHPGND